ncbi:hypothetical protein HYH03_011364 [Edaphochlamys debaryana]|uniref:Uncharacterized protein n=1 Tax=Edaphochlamys debaryana TaxID=47281 RepID=A0A836BVA3_9CHLO|nr:hypothetical protein HYH03_011364 [Edaphochlamys debaryana]|eukprot:KAG2490240.1 hypothetical protein HYH03_011364 [Edaphochlamys debaryana]
MGESSRRVEDRQLRSLGMQFSLRAASRWLAILLVVALPGVQQALAQQQPLTAAAGVPGADGTVLSTANSSLGLTQPLVNYTRLLLDQGLAALGQAVLVPNRLFRSRRCQVVYLANPDWARMLVGVQFVDGSMGACGGGGGAGGQQRQAAVAYVDGFRLPRWAEAAAGDVALSSTGGAWSAVVQSPEGGSATASAANRRSLVTLGNTSFTVTRSTFDSVYREVRTQALATQEFLTRGGDDPRPEPDGELAAPRKVSRLFAGSVAEQSDYSRGELVEAQRRASKAGGIQPNVAILTDRARIYTAPEADCLAALGAAKQPPYAAAPPPGAAAGSFGPAGAKGLTVADAPSCYVTQAVVYIYNPCVDANATDSSAPEDYSLNPDPLPTNASTTPATSVNATSNATAPVNASVNAIPAAGNLTQLLLGGLQARASAQGLNTSDGYVLVTVTYTPYDNCVHRGVDSLADVCTQIMIFCALAFGWLALFLLLPSLYRLFLEFPARLLVHGLRQLFGRDDRKLKPMKPGLHSHKSHLGLRPTGRLGRALGPLLRLRKHMLYAVATVHSSDGQSRMLQVSVLSNVALSVGMAVYAPRTDPPLDHFVPKLALQIARGPDAAAALLYFIDIVLFSCLMGTLGYLSMLANYNTPVNQYYRVQVAVSAFFMGLQDLLVVLQITSVLAQWTNLHGPWPLLPLVVFQLANLMVANVWQGVIFVRRHNVANRNLYAAFMANRADRSRAEAEERADAKAAAKTRRLEAQARLAADQDSDEDDEYDMYGDGGGGRWSAGGGAGGGGLVGANGVLVELAEDGSVRPRPNGDKAEGERAGFINFRRHRLRTAKQQKGAPGEGEEEEGQAGDPRELLEEGGTGRGKSAGAGAVPSRQLLHSEEEEQEEEEEPEPPRRHSRGGRQAGRRRAAAGPDLDLDLDLDPGDLAPALAPAASEDRPRRRLLDDGPGPVGEGREVPYTSLTNGWGVHGSDESVEGGVGARHKRPQRRLFGDGDERSASISGAPTASIGGGWASAGPGVTVDPGSTRSPRSHYAPGGLPRDAEANGDVSVRRLLAADAAADDDDGYGNSVPYHKRPYVGRAGSGVNGTAAAHEGELARAGSRDSAKPYAAKKAAGRDPAPADGPTKPRPAPGRSSKPQLPQPRSAAAASAAAPRPPRRELIHASSRGADSSGWGDGSDGGSSDAGPGGLRAVVLWPVTFCQRMWRGLRESPDFRYPAWLIAALLVSGYMLIFQYARALQWSTSIGNCMLDPAECAADNLGRYVRFAAHLFSRDQQTRLRDAIQSLAGTRGDVQDMLASAVLGSNSTNSSANATADSPGFLSSITANLTALLNNITARASADVSRDLNYTALVAGAVEGTAQGAPDSAGSAALRDDPDLRAALEAQLSAAVDQALRERLGSLASLARDANRTASAAALSANSTALRAQAYAFLNGTLDTLYSALNTSSGFLNKALEVQGDIVAWQEGLHNRFVWSSALGFTLGLGLGLSTLVQTAVSFRRAVRQARRARFARRIFAGGSFAGPLARAEDRDPLLGGHGGAGESSLVAHRARATSISLVMFFFGVLMSTAVIQLYMVGVLLTTILAIGTHPWTWNYFIPNFWLYILAIAMVFVLNKYVLIGYVGNAFLSNGHHIYRPAAWLAFISIMSITNLAIGMLLAVYRIVLLLLTTVVALGKLEVSIFMEVFAWLDLPHQTFLAGLHMHEAIANFADPIYLPGPRGRAHRRWRKLRDIVRKLSPEELRLLATLGRPKEVQTMLDDVMVGMQVNKALAAASLTLPPPPPQPPGRPSGLATSSAPHGARGLSTSGASGPSGAAAAAGAGAGAGAGGGGGKPPLGPSRLAMASRGLAAASAPFPAEGSVRGGMEASQPARSRLANGSTAPGKAQAPEPRPSPAQLQLTTQRSDSLRRAGSYRASGRSGSGSETAVGGEQSRIMYGNGLAALPKRGSSSRHRVEPAAAEEEEAGEGGGWEEDEDGEEEEVREATGRGQQRTHRGRGGGDGAFGPHEEEEEEEEGYGEEGEEDLEAGRRARQNRTSSRQREGRDRDRRGPEPEPLPGRSSQGGGGRGRHSRAAEAGGGGGSGAEPGAAAGDSQYAQRSGQGAAEGGRRGGGGGGGRQQGAEARRAAAPAPAPVRRLYEHVDAGDDV